MWARIAQKGAPWKLLRPHTAGLTSDSWTWMSPTWDLYEKWCFVRLAQALQLARPGLSWTRVKHSGTARCFQGTGDGCLIRLSWQPEFHRSAANSQFTSISKTLRPDFVITVAQGDQRRWLALDAKYSQMHQSVLSAMQSAHIYHDALRCFGRPPHRSLLLLPATADGVDWMYESDFKAAHGVGILTCSPDADQREKLVNEVRGLIE
jgi:hypothetical protein